MAENEISYKGTDIQKRIPGLLELVMLDDVAVELRKMNKHFAKTEFKGATTAYTFNATNQEQYKDVIPDTPALVSVSLLNVGPQSALFRINGAGEWAPLFLNIPQNIDCNGADERIWRISYKCPNPADTAVITAVGKY